MSMDTPILLIAWRRPHLLSKVIDAIRSVAPTHVFVACDGPNPARPAEAEKVAFTRAVIETEIDWSCRVERLYSDVNQGCRLGPSRAINWFFSKVKEGIILEDDCIPHPDFFTYCEWALDAFRSDKTVMHINGNNFSAPSSLFQEEVGFVSLPQAWGWASWSDRWESFDCNPFSLSYYARPDKWRLSNSARLAALMRLESLKKGLDTWDYQWQISVLNNCGYAVSPRSNLISNIGKGPDASHTFNDHERTFLRTSSLAKPRYAPKAKFNKKLSRFYEKQMGLQLSPDTIIWVFRSFYLALCNWCCSILRQVLFRDYVPIVVASSGRAGSTMLANSIAHSFIESRFSGFPNWIRRALTLLALTYSVRLKDVASFDFSPVIKTHDLFSDEANPTFRYIFVYADPLESAMSVRSQELIHGSSWVDAHIFHLAGNGDSDQLFSQDVLNYEAQVLTWRRSPAFLVDYLDIWNCQEVISRFLGFSLLLPSRRERSSKSSIVAHGMSKDLFVRLKKIMLELKDYTFYQD